MGVKALSRGARDEKDLFHAFIHFPVSGETFGKHKAIPFIETVDGAVRVNHAAAAFKDVAELHIAHAIGAESTSRSLPNSAGERAVKIAEAFQRFVGRVAMNGAAGLSSLGFAQVLSFNTNQIGECSHGM